MRVLLRLLALLLITLLVGGALLALFPIQPAQLAVRLLAPTVSTTIGAWQWRASGVDLDDVAVRLPHATATFTSVTLRWQHRAPQQLVITLTDGSVRLNVPATNTAPNGAAGPARTCLLPCAVSLTATRIAVAVTGAHTPVPLRGTCSIHAGYTPGQTTQAWLAASFVLRDVCAGSVRMLLPAHSSMLLAADLASSNVAQLADLFPASAGMFAPATIARISGQACLDPTSQPLSLCVSAATVTLAADVPRMAARTADATAHGALIDAALALRQPLIVPNDLAQLVPLIAARADACVTARMAALTWRMHIASNISVCATLVTGMVHVADAHADLAGGAAHCRGSARAPAIWPPVMDACQYTLDATATNFDSRTVTHWLPAQLSNLSAVVSGQFRASGTGVRVQAGYGTGSAALFHKRAHLADTAFAVRTFAATSMLVAVDGLTTNLTRIASALAVPFTITRSGSLARVSLQAWLDSRDQTARVAHATCTVYAVCSRIYAKQSKTTVRNSAVMGTLALARPIAFNERPRDPLAFAINAVSGSLTGRATQVAYQTLAASNAAFVANVLTTFVHLTSTRIELFDGEARVNGAFARRKVKGQLAWRFLYDGALQITNLNAAEVCRAFHMATNRLDGLFAGQVRVAGFGTRVNRFDGTIHSQHGGILYFPESTYYVSSMADSLQKQIIDIMIDRLREYGFQTSRIGLQYDKDTALTVFSFQFMGAVDNYTFDIPYHGTWYDALRLALSFK